MKGRLFIVLFAALFLSGGVGIATASSLTGKNISTNHSLGIGQRLTVEIMALGDCPSEAAVLDVVHRGAGEVDQASLAASLEMKAAAQAWRQMGRDALASAGEAAQTALGIRDEGSNVQESTGAVDASSQINTVLRLGGYGPVMGSGGSAYSY